MGLERRGAGAEAELESDAIRHVEVGVLASLLNRSDEISGLTFGLEFWCDLGVEHDHCLVPRQRRGNVTLLGIEQKVELVGLEHVVADGHGVVVAGRPVTRLRGLDDRLDFLAESRPEDTGVRNEPEGAVGVDVIAELDLLHVELVGEQLGQRFDGGVGVGPGEHGLGERQPNPESLRFAQCERRRDGVKKQIHGRDEVGIGWQCVDRRPIFEVDRSFTDETLPDLLGDHRHEWSQHLREIQQHGVERVEGIVIDRAALGVPEALSAASDVPVGERIEVALDGVAGTGEVVGIEPLGRLGDQLLGLGQDVAIEIVGGVGALGGSVAVGVRVEREEAECVPDRQHHLAGDVVDGLIADA